MSDDLNVKIQAILEADESASASKIKSQIPNIEKALKSSTIKIPVEVDAANTGQSVQDAVKKATSSLKTSGMPVAIDVPLKFNIGKPSEIKAEVERAVASITGNKGKMIRFDAITDGLGNTQKILLQYRNDVNETVQTVLKLKQVGEVIGEDGTVFPKLAWEVDSASFKKNFEQLEKAKVKIEELKRAAEILKKKTPDNIALDFGKFDAAINEGNVTRATAALKELRDQFTLVNAAVPKDLAANALEKLPEKINSANESLQTLSDRFTILQTKGVEVPTGMFDRLKTLSSELQSMTSDAMGVEDVGRFKELTLEINNIASAATKMESALRVDKAVTTADTLTIRYEKLLQTLDVIKTKYSAFTKDPALLAQFDGIREKVASAINVGDMSQQGWTNLNAQVGLFTKTVEAAGKASKTLWGQIGDNAKKFLNWFLIGGATATIARSIKEVISSVVDLNKAFVDIQMVTNGTNAETDKLMKSYSSLAKRLGATTTEVASAASDWLRQGFSTNDTETLIENSMVLSKVGAIDSAAATNYLTTAMKGYGLAVEDTLGVVDKLSAVDLVSATSAGGLAEGMSEVANNARLAGVEMDKLLGYLAVVGETTGKSMSAVGTTLNAIFSRMGNIKLSRLKDYQNETNEDLSNVETVLRGEGIALRDSANSFRDFGDVLDETASRWDSFSEVSQRAIASAFAGTRQMEEFLVLMENYGKATEYAAVASESTGTAMEKMGAYQEGIEARQKRATAASQEFSNAILNSDLIKFTYDAGTGILGFLTQITETLGALPVLAAAASAALSFKNVGFLKKDAAGSIMPFWNVAKSNNAAQASKDISALNLFADLKDKDGASAADAFAAAMSGASEEAKKLASSTDFSRDAIKGFEAAQIKSVASTGKFSASLKGLGSILKSVSATLVNMAVVMLIGTAISWVAEQISNAIHIVDRLEDAATTSIGEFQDVQSEVNDLNNELDETAARIKELEGTNLSFVEQEELDGLKQQNEELTREIEARKELAEIKNREAVQALDSVYKTKYGSSNSKYMVRYLEDAPYADWLSQNIGGDKGFDVFGEIMHVRVLTQAEALGKLADLLKDAESGVPISTGILNAFSWDDVGDSFDDLRAYLLQGVVDLENYAAQYESIGAQIPSGLADLLDNMYSALNPAWEKEKAFESYWNSDTAHIRGVRAELEELALAGELTADILLAKYPLIAKDFEDLKISAEEAVQQIISVTDGAREEGSLTALESLGASLTSLAEKASLVQDAMAEQADNGFLSNETYQKLIGINSDFASSLQLTASGWQINEEALWGYLEAQGEVTKGDALSAMVDLQEELNATEITIAELQDRYGDLDDAGKANLDMLMDHAAGLQTEINQYGFLIGKIDAATGAYKRWLTAKSSKNKDEMFNEGEEMYEVLKEGNKIGKTGTDDFQDSVGFMLGENWEDQYDDRQKAYAAAQKKGKRYFGQKDERQGTVNFAKDLGENYEGASWDGKNLVIETGSTLEGMAEAMGMSEDAIRSLFGLLSTYEIDFDWVEKLTDGEIEQIKSVEEANDALEQQEQQLANLEGKDTTVMDAEEVTENEANIEATKTAISGLQEKIEELNNNPPDVSTEAPELSPLEQLQQTLTDIQTAITTLETHGMTIPVSMTDDAEALQTMITALSVAGGLSLDIQAGGADAAKTAVEAIQTALQFIKDNPNVSAEVSASLTDTGKAAITAIGLAMGWDEETIDLILNATDNVTPVVDQIETDGGKTTVDVNADKETFDSEMAEAESGGEDGYKAAIPVTSNAAEVGGEIDAIAKDRESVITIKPVVATVSDEEIEKYGYTLGDDGFVYGQSGLIVGAAPAKTELGNPDTNHDHPIDWNPKDWTNNEDVEVPVSPEQESLDDIPIKVQEKLDEEELLIEPEIKPSDYAPVELPVEPELQTSTLPPAELPLEPELLPSDSPPLAVPIQPELDETVIVHVDADTTTASNAIDKLGDKTVTVTVKQKMSGYTYASGTKNADPGVSLVDDGGKGRELIHHVSDGTFELGSDSGPRLVNIKKGDTVYTGAETKKILARSKNLRYGFSFKDGLKDTLNKGKLFVGRTFAAGVSGVGDFSNMLKSMLSSSSSSSSSSKKNTSSSKSSTKSAWKTYLEKLFDWVEIRLEKLQKITEAWTREVERAIGYVAKNKAIDNTLKSITDQLTALTQAYHRYIEQANTIASKTKLSSSIVSMIQTGTIDIALYNSNTQTKIKEYQEWWEKAQSVTEQIEELYDQQQELNEQKLENISNEYDKLANSIDGAISKSQSYIDVLVASGKKVKASDYSSMIESTQDKIVKLMEGRIKLAAEFNKQITDGTLVAGSDAWYENIDRLNSLDEAINSAKIDLIELNDAINNIVVTNLGYALTGLQNTQRTIEQTLDLIGAQGRVPTEGMYRQLISSGMQQIDNLRKQNEELAKQKDGLEENSEKYQEILETIRDNESAISDIQISQEGWNDAILDLRIDELTRVKEYLEKNNESYQRQLDLQQAIEDLEKAKSQRTIKVLENGKFVYKRDEEDVADKQMALDQKMHEQTLSKIDETIDAIEKSKETSNVWESLGWSSTSLAEIFPDASIEDLISSVLGSGNTGVDLASILGANNGLPTVGGNNSTSDNRVTLTFGEGSIVMGSGDPYEFIRILQTEMTQAFTVQQYTSK